MTRFQISGWHLFLSTCVGTLLFSIFWFAYYPTPTFSELGVLPVFLLLVSIDVVLGPVLTLLVYKPKKKTLKFDLTVIVLLQIAAMAYGVSTLLEARPVYIAALGNHFQVVQATEVTDANLVKAGVSLPWIGPQWVGTQAPVDLADKNTVEMLALVGAGRGHLPQLHTPYTSIANEVLAHALPIAQLKTLNSDQAKAIDAWLKKHGHTPDTARYQPLIVGPARLAVILNAKTAAVVGMAPFKSTEE